LRVGAADLRPYKGAVDSPTFEANVLDCREKVIRNIDDNRNLPDIFTALEGLHGIEGKRRHQGQRHQAGDRGEEHPYGEISAHTGRKCPGKGRYCPTRNEAHRHRDLAILDREDDRPLM